jgi:hypothetical protein
VTRSGRLMNQSRLVKRVATSRVVDEVQGVARWQTTAIGM